MAHLGETGAPAGVGLGLRWAFSEEAVQGPLPDALAFFEITPENYMHLGGARREHLEILRERRPMLSHGLSANLGGSDPLELDELADLGGFLRELGLTHHSDHLCWTGHRGAALHELLPLPHTVATAERVARRIRAWRRAVDVPVSIENVTFYAQPGPSSITELDFIERVLTLADCGWLLDVHNLWVNAANHGFAAHAWLDAAPLSRVVCMHVAGGRVRDDLDGLWIDDHSAAVPDEVIELMQYALERTGPVPVVYERDNDIPELGALYAEIERIDAAFADAVGGRTSPAQSLRSTPPRTADPRPNPGLDPSPDVLDALDHACRDVDAPSEPRAQIGVERLGVMRALVRESLAHAPTQLLPRTRARRGATRFDADLAHWIAEVGARSPRLRDLAAELVAWGEPAWSLDDPALVDLARWELARHRLRCAEDAVGDRYDPSALDVDHPLAFAPCELLQLDVDPRLDRLPPNPGLVVVMWRSEGLHVRTLDPEFVETMARLIAGESLAHALGGGPDSPVADDRLARFGVLLAELVERGCVLGRALSRDE